MSSRFVRENKNVVCWLPDLLYANLGSGQSMDTKGYVNLYRTCVIVNARRTVDGLHILQAFGC